MHISRHYRDDHLKTGNIETLIAIYEDQVRGWFFDHATALEKSSDHAGLVTLLVVLSYVEGHAIFYRGEDSKRDSRGFFREAFKVIFRLSGEESEARDKAINEVYGEMRCGLFHTGMTRGKVLISNHHEDSITITNTAIMVNPKLLLASAEDHLSHYLMRLRNPDEKVLRANFEKAWKLRG
jgi:hypothetical protein